MPYLFLLGVAAFFPLQAQAHAFGQQFALPLPVNFYILGGVAAFVISCAFLSLIGKTAGGPLRAVPLSKGAWSAFEVSLQAVFLVLLLGGLGFGLFGTQSAFFNPLPYLFWIGLVLVLPYLSVLVAGLWEVGNPFRTMLSVIKWPLPEGKRPWRYGYAPALILYAGLLTLELFLPQFSTFPWALALIIIGYALYLIVGSYVYGARDWFRYADLFTVFMRLAGMLAPVRLTEGKIVFGLPAQRLVSEQPTRLTLVWFILLALAGTAYDGFRETKVLLAFILDVLQTPWIQTQFVIFLLFPLAFCALYLGTIAVMKLLVRGESTLFTYARRFAYSLVPIMLAYHFAHYFSLMFSTLKIVISADIVWYIQLGTIVLGHAFAAYIAHQIALAAFPTKRAALISQVPLILLMVFYTGFGLWILAQPFGT